MSATCEHRSTDKITSPCFLYALSRGEVNVTGKVVGRPFPKGVSGNPGGRPKGNPEVKEILKAGSPEAARKLVELLNSEKEQIRFWAAQEILNRTEGKPMQAVNMEVSGGLDVRSQIRELLLGENEKSE